MENYKFLSAGSVLRISDGACIPFSEGNCDYERFLTWIDEGNTPEPIDQPPNAIRIVSPRQIRQALTASGLRAQVEAAVAAGDQDLKDWWEFATQLEQNHPMVNAMAIGIGVTGEQLDALFELAASL